MIVVVGHGPSILSGLGSVIDSCTVVRVKFGRKEDPEHWGTRTDYVCGRGIRHGDKLPSSQFWYFNEQGWARKWVGYFRTFEPKFSTDYGAMVPKPSHGLCAAFAVMEHLSPREIAFIGCDRLLRPDAETWKWNMGPTCFPHDWQAEHRALHGLGIKVIDLVEYAQQVSEATKIDGSSRSRSEVRQEGRSAGESSQGIQPG